MGRAPKDSGYAWVVALGTAVHMYFVTGGLKAMGILFMDLVVIFDADTRLTALTLGLVAAGFAIFSVIAIGMSAALGYRPVVMIGAVICALSAFLTVFATNIVYVIILLGFLTGVAYGAMGTPAVFILNCYFDKRKSLANGVAFCGASVGQLTLPYITAYLLQEYGFSGAMLIYCGLCLHTIPAALLLRPVEFYTKTRLPKHEGNVKLAVVAKMPDTTSDKISLRTGQSVGHSTASLHSTVSARRRAGLPTGRAIHTSTGSLMMGLSLESLASLGLQLNPEDDLDVQPEKALNGSVRSLGRGGRQSDGAAAGDSPVKKQSACQVATNVFRAMVDCELLSSPVFWTFWFALGLGNAGFLAACLFMPSYAKELFGTKYAGALLISIMGGTDIIGRIAGGAFADLGLMRRSDLTAIGMLGPGLASLFLVMYPVFPMLALWSVVMGLVGGLYRILMPVVIRDLFGLAKLGTGLGLCYCSCGIIILPIPTILETMTLILGSYRPSLQLCGALMVVGSMLMFALRGVQKVDHVFGTQPVEAGQVAESSERDPEIAATAAVEGHQDRHV